MRGLKLAPWLELLKRREPRTAEQFDCRRCQESLTERQRQLKGCGFLPMLPSADLRVWDASNFGRAPGPGELERDKATGKLHVINPVCVGYVCNLPQVDEASRAHWFTRNGGIQQFEHRPSPELLDAVLVIESEYAGVLAWCSKNPEPAP